MATTGDTKSIRIGGACGYWGESAMATPQFLRGGNVDFIVFDYLAEITMSIMARAKAKDPVAGYATDFVSAVLVPNLPEIATQRVRIIANAGGVNPEACGAAVREAVKAAGLDLKVAVITGDDLATEKDAIAKITPREMFSGDAFPDPAKVASINLYLGAFPIAHALDAGADIVITGRCVDSALTLGACIHAFGWREDEWDKLASGSLAGHIIECGPQATGGNFTDWRDAGDITNIGYPIAEISPDGTFDITKPPETSGLVSVGTVSEQMVYEIGDPQAYILPDVVCDFCEVVIKQIGDNRVSVSGAKGAPATDTYKTCVTWEDGFRAGLTLPFYGLDAPEKAQSLGNAILARARNTLRKFNAGDFTETSMEIVGAGSQFGGLDKAATEVVLKLAVKHPAQLGAGLMLKEAAGIGLATPPGLATFAGGRPKPSPVLKLFSYLTPKAGREISIEADGETEVMQDKAGAPFDPSKIIRPSPPPNAEIAEPVEVPMIKLAWARSGDKGDKANIGVIARHADYLTYIWQALTPEYVAEVFAHFIDADVQALKVERFLLPGSNAMNLLIDNVLGGGGVASLRLDPQGKGYAQILLSQTIPVPNALAAQLNRIV